MSITPNALRAERPRPVFGGLKQGLQEARRAPAAWKLAVFEGRLAELSGARATAALTLAFRLVLEAQRRGDPVAWVSRSESAFYPPDAADAAVDLDALAVVWVAEARAAARAADRLVRSGAFGLVVLDLGRESRIPLAAQSRLMGLAKKHHAAVVCLTEKSGRQPSVGSLVSVRVEASRSYDGESGRFRCEAQALKDKRCGPGWSHAELFHGPDGLP